MCIGARLFGKRKAQSSVTLSSKIGIDSFDFSFEASAFQSVSKNSTRITHPRKIQAPSKGTRGARANERCFTIVSLFFFSLFSLSFLVRLIFEIRVYPRKTRVHALRFLLPGKLHFEKSIFYPSLFLARARVAHDEYLCSYARIRARTGDELPLLPIVYDLFHDKGIIAAMEGIVAMVNFVTCALAHIPFFGFISTIPSRREVVSED